jgi:hypothetical protein
MNRSLQPRALRVAADFPLSYLAEPGVGPRIEGNCLNISDSGLLGEFAESLDLWTEGEVVVQFGGGALGVRVRVARVDGTRAGFVFLYEDSEQRRTIAEVVASAMLEMKQKGHSGTIPF